LAILLGVGVAAMLLAGCGSDSDTTTESEPLTKAAFIKQGDALCKESNDEIAAASKEFLESQGAKAGEFPSPAQIEQIGKEIFIPHIEERVDGLRELSPPVGDEAQVEAILVATEDGLVTAKKISKSLFASGAKNYPFAKSNKLMSAYGFEVCPSI
jgi:hypothetical protein